MAREGYGGEGRKYWNVSVADKLSRIPTLRDRAFYCADFDGAFSNKWTPKAVSYVATDDAESKKDYDYWRGCGYKTTSAEPKGAMYMIEARLPTDSKWRVLYIGISSCTLLPYCSRDRLQSHFGHDSKVDTFKIIHDAGGKLRASMVEVDQDVVAVIEDYMIHKFRPPLNQVMRVPVEEDAPVPDIAADNVTKHEDTEQWTKKVTASSPGSRVAAHFVD